MGRGLSRRCRGGVAAVALVSLSVKPATVTKKLAGWGGGEGKRLVPQASAAPPPRVIRSATAPNAGGPPGDMFGMFDAPLPLPKIT